MALCERRAGTRLEVTLKRKCAPLVGEFDDDVDVPWTTVRGMSASSFVMTFQPGGDIIRRHASVVPARLGFVPQNVNEALGSGHRSSACNAIAARQLEDSSGDINIEPATFSFCQIAKTWDDAESAIVAPKSGGQCGCIP
jgi:hypothetical protein